MVAPHRRTADRRQHHGQTQDRHHRPRQDLPGPTSELRRAFEIGFLLFVPFLIIDMVVASVLMSMGMMMLPPVMIALPFKLVFFVLVDGWYLVAGSLVRSFGGS